MRGVAIALAFLMAGVSLGFAPMTDGPDLLTGPDRQSVEESLHAAANQAPWLPVQSALPSLGTGESYAAGFGDAGPAAFHQYTPPSGFTSVGSAGEPTVGIPWDTDSVFYMAGASTYRARFDDSGATAATPASVNWARMSNTWSITNVDPMLHTDAVTGRTWAGGLDGPCSIMGYSDDDGASWQPAGNMCTGAQFDHQSLGSGPWANPMPTEAIYPHGTYYCAQLALTACTTSLDGGVTWLPITEVQGGCGGLHGHIRVSPVTGTAVVPDASCSGGRPGFGITTNNGLTWTSITIPGALNDPQVGFDPSIDFSEENGWMYYTFAGSRGIYVGLSKDDGLTWDNLGGGHGQSTSWLDIGRLADPPVLAGTFNDIMVGDDDRAAVSFLGVSDTPNNYDGMYSSCSKKFVWHYYVGFTYDAGQTWDVRRISDDPVQVGAIWKGQGGSCRNLLDFNDMDMDSTGRLTIAFADGCRGTCADTYLADGDADDINVGHSRSRYAGIFRQATGKGLLAAHDAPAELTVTASGGSADVGQAATATAQVRWGQAPYDYAWSLTDAPAGADTHLANAATATVSLTTDTPGAYGLTVLVTDALGATASASASMAFTLPTGPDAADGPGGTTMVPGIWHPADNAGTTTRAFQVYVPAGQATLAVSLDADRCLDDHPCLDELDLHVAHGTTATPAAADCSAIGTGSDVACAIAAPEPGWWSIVVQSVGPADTAATYRLQALLPATPSWLVEDADAITDQDGVCWAKHYEGQGGLYVQDRPDGGQWGTGLVGGGGTWVYQEGNGIPGLQLGGLGEPDYAGCDNPDVLIF